MKTIPQTRMGLVVPKVSVLMLTYNHERYLAHAIESVLKQVLACEYELLVGDDFSPDCTHAIATAYQAKHPATIQVHRADRNRGMYRNFLNLLAHSRGEYIAFLEGDDFWLCPDKLQRQITFLDGNRHCSLSFHRVRLARPDGTLTEDVFPVTTKALLTLEDILEENQIPTASVVFRRSALPAVPAWCEKVKILDWPLFMLITSNGPAAFFDEPMAAYRLHSAGAWSALSAACKSQRQIETLMFAKEHFTSRLLRCRMRKTLSKLHSHIAWCREDSGAITEAFASAREAVAYQPCRYNIIQLLRLMLKACCPWLVSVRNHLKKRRLRSVSIRMDISQQPSSR